MLIWALEGSTDRTVSTSTWFAQVGSSVLIGLGQIAGSTKCMRGPDFSRVFHMAHPGLCLETSTVGSGKNVTFFEQLFCFYQLVLVLWNTFGAKFKLSFISWVKQNWDFLWQWRKKLPFPHLGGLWGKRGPEKSFLRSRVQKACATRLFLLDHRSTCTDSFHITSWPWKPVQLDGHLDWLHFDTCGFLNNYTCTRIRNWHDFFKI